MNNNFSGNNKNTVAAIQMCSSHILSDNLILAEQLITDAARNHAKLVVLPEMFAIIGLSANDKTLAKEPFGEGEIQRFLSTQAKKNKVWIVGGTIPIEGNNHKKIRASSLVFNADGACVARYDKIHLFDVTVSEKEVYQESDSTEPGDQLVVIDTPVGRLGLGVCYDLRFPELFRSMFDKNVQIISIPSAFTVTTGKAHWELLARCRAIENYCYLVGACQGGSHSNGRKTYGHSVIIDPWGDIIAKKTSIEPGVIYAEVDLSKVGSIMVPAS